ncbi:hypothetical protein BU26DRAFT_523534 [Trematosphaeria pertusa]|uniref:Uncharacterized protein n=1 Tax=Trematosphaeria pertusa TaxID=390896 RepID=A0A6A6I296_9PLEO|nr:uncharacterized protein BU26DRAFT_523534 [Trematosphaeria pertusa]KAF2243993.1 hypothetical protein BU26DRAFT_523534 [Trematosphaeria pertusa]
MNRPAEGSSATPNPATGECYFKVIDIFLDGKPPVIRGEGYTEHDAEKSILGLPTQLENTIRVFLDGRSSRVGQYIDSYRTPEAPYPSCLSRINPPNEHGWISTRACFPSSQRLQDYGIPALRQMWEASVRPAAYRAPAFARHLRSCPNWSDFGRSSVVKQDEYEAQSVAFAVMHKEGRAVMVCSALNASTDKMQHASSEAIVCANAAWRWLENIDLSLSRPECLIHLAGGHEELAIRLILLEVLLVNLRQTFAFISDLESNEPKAMVTSYIWSFFHPKEPFPIASRLNGISGRLLTLQEVEDPLICGVAGVDYVSNSVRLMSERIQLPARFNSIKEELQNIWAECDFYKLYISRRKERYNEVHKMLSNMLSIKQADSVNRPTLLAALFLPLSLSAGILSMQTRFADLHLLLYDFVGLIFLLGTVAAVLAILDRHGLRVYDRIIDIAYGWRTVSKHLTRALQFAIAIVWWLVFLVSFLVGMLSSVKLGLKVLGFEAAGVVVLWLISLKAVRVAYDWTVDRRVRAHWDWY